MVDSDPIVRSLAAEATGRLCNISGNSLIASEIKHLVEMIVTNRDPNVRAGCVTALGCIHSHVGGMAAGFHLKTAVGVLMSLCSDPHPVVHFWALDALIKVVDSAGLTFSSYVSGTLGLLAQIYVSDTHNDEVASLASSNTELDFSCPVLVGRCLDSLINVLGPDLQDISKTRDLIFRLVKQFQSEQDAALVIESYRCLEHLSLYAPNYVDLEAYVRQLQADVSSGTASVREAALYGLNNLMKQDAERIFNIASPGLEDSLWLALDQVPGHPAVINIIRNWLLQTGLEQTELWVQRCQKVLWKSKLKSEDVPPPVSMKTAGPDLQDEEVAGFAAAAAATHGQTEDGAATTQELLRWQTRSFAMACMNELLSMTNHGFLPDQTVPAELALQQRVGDIIRLAFSASTANVVELRIWGLKIIDQILKVRENSTSTTSVH